MLSHSSTHKTEFNPLDFDWFWQALYRATLFEQPRVIKGKTSMTGTVTFHSVLHLSRGETRAGSVKGVGIVGIVQ